MRQPCFFSQYSCSIEKAPSKNRIRTPDLRKGGPPKNKAVWKTGHKDVKALPFVSYRIKDNGKWFVFVQITFEKCTRNLHFQTSKVDINAPIAN